MFERFIPDELHVTGDDIIQEYGGTFVADVKEEVEKLRAAHPALVIRRLKARIAHLEKKLWTINCLASTWKQEDVKVGFTAIYEESKNP